VKDTDYVAAIVDCLGRPLQNPYGDYYKTSPEEYVTREVQLHIDTIRHIHLHRKPVQNWHADKQTLLQLLRKFGYSRWADTIEYQDSLLISPPRPRSNVFKYACAREAYHLMADFTRQKPTHSVNSGFNRIASLLYEAATGKEPEDSLERACSAIIKEIRKPEKPRERRDAGPPMPPKFRDA
jgi:hypothetical protein